MARNLGEKMREIKFRVWDKVEKKMYYPETLISSPWMMSLDGDEAISPKGGK